MSGFCNCFHSICFAKCCSASHRFTKVYVVKSGEDAPKEYVDVFSRGFEVGRSVTLTERLTGFVVVAKDDDVSRNDVNPAQIGTITDVPVGSTSRVMITFLTDLQVMGKTKCKSVEVALKAHVNDVQLVVAKAAPAEERREKTSGAGSAHATHRKYPFLQREGQNAPDIIEEWDARQALHGICATEGEMPEAKAKTVLAMLAMNFAKPLSSRG